MSTKFPVTYEVFADVGVLVAGARPSLAFGPPPEFGGDARVWTPEHLLVSSAASCFLETFQAMAKRTHLVFASPKCRATGTLERTGFSSIELFVEISVAGVDAARAQDLLAGAKSRCFVANTLKCPVELRVELKELGPLIARSGVRFGDSDGSGRFVPATRGAEPCRVARRLQSARSHSKGILHMRAHTIAGAAIIAVVAAATAFGCNKMREDTASTLGASASIRDLMKARGLGEADVEAALKTYVPTGKMDEYYVFASGGQSGNVDVIGVPSMRMLKVIGVFTPESWQGWGYGGDSERILDQGNQGAHRIRWADMHHPNLSETRGDYDGKFLFVNDKANARVAVVDLADFTTKQIVANPLAASDHGGAFVTPDTDYVIETSQYPAPLGREYAPVSEYKEKYRGVAIFWKFDRQKGRIDKDKSWAMELPPYTQDLADAGKLASDGWAYINSFNTEMAVGGTLEGKPPVESGASQNDMDYLHVIDWKKAEALVSQGRTKTIAGMRVLMMDVSGPDGVLTLVGEPKSPHGCDVTPDGKMVIVGGKLDTHATLYDVEKMKALIQEKRFEGKDAFGVPIMKFKDAIAGQIEIGLGPLHTVFDDKGNAYTSVFIESAVAKWSVADLKKPVEKLKVHYNIGHILAAEGDTVSPDGKYVVAMNKMSMDRFLPVGPLYPQNFQLIDIDGDKMRMLADMPLPNAEPHYSQMIKADKLKPVKVYKPGTNAHGEVDPARAEGGKERVVKNGNKVEVFMTAIRSHFTPDRIEVEEGDEVTLHITSLETAEDQTHGFTIDMYNINLSLEPGKHENVTFKADMPGTYPMYCTEFCSALHLEMMGYFLVKPKKH